MNIDLFSVIDCEGGELPFSGTVKTGGEGFTATSAVDGKAVNFSGRVEIYARVKSEISALCDRCLKPVSAALEFEISEIAGEEDAALDGTFLDVSELTERYLYMNMPMKLLCFDDCKGLCPVCGADFNVGECGCDKDEPDERLAVLKKWLTK